MLWGTVKLVLEILLEQKVCGDEQWNFRWNFWNFCNGIFAIEFQWNNGIFAIQLIVLIYGTDLKRIYLKINRGFT